MSLMSIYFPIPCGISAKYKSANTPSEPSCNSSKLIPSTFPSHDASDIHTY